MGHASLRTTSTTTVADEYCTMSMRVLVAYSKHVESMHGTIDCENAFAEVLRNEAGVASV